MKLDTKNKTLLNVAFLSVILIAILAGILWPTIVNINNTTLQTVQLRSYLEDKYEQSLLSRITKNKVLEIKSQYPDLNKHIFHAGDELKLITYLETLASNKGLTQKISSSNIDQITNNKISIALDLGGAYDDIFKYLTDLESSDYFLNIEQIQITPSFNRNGIVTENAELYLTLGLYVNK